MALIRWDPSRSHMPLREAMHHLFEESFIGPRSASCTIGGCSFPMDVYEAQDHRSYVIEAALPGFKPEEITITATGNWLTIKAIKQEEQKAEKETYVRREGIAGEMVRTVELPGIFHANAAGAIFEHGILTLHVPKAYEAKLRLHHPLEGVR